jgi:hypothetical protein
MTSSSASDNANSTEITVSMQKGATTLWMEVNRNFGTWLSYSRGISETSGKHLLYLVTKATVTIPP